MGDDRLRYRVDNLGRALARLEEALAAPIDPRNLALDATIQARRRRLSAGAGP